jgi:hypothetical protein
MHREKGDIQKMIWTEIVKGAVFHSAVSQWLQHYETDRVLKDPVFNCQAVDRSVLDLFTNFWGCK